MEVIVKVPSTYFEIDTSKYRLAISELTLIESLKQQTDKKFHLILEVSAMDPCYTKRIKAFKAVKVPLSIGHEDVTRSAGPFTEIEVDDDTFLQKDLVATLKQMPTSEINRYLLAPNGYVFQDAKLHVCSEKPDLLTITQFVQADRRVRGAILFTCSHCWIHVRHARNDTLPFDQKTSKSIVGLNWPGWCPNIVEKYCAVRVVEASAQGADLYPTRSKSVVYAHNSARGRRKK